MTFWLDDKYHLSMLIQKNLFYLRKHYVFLPRWATVSQRSGLSCNTAEIFPNWFMWNEQPRPGNGFDFYSSEHKHYKFTVTRETFLIGTRLCRGNNSLRLTFSLWNASHCLLRRPGQLAVLSPGPDKVLWNTNHWVYTTGRDCKRVEWGNIQCHTSVFSWRRRKVTASTAWIPYRWYNICCVLFWNPFTADDSRGKCF